MIAILFFLLAFFPISSYSQDTSIQYTNHAPYAFGIMTGTSFISNRSIIPVIPNSNDCGIYESGTSNGLSLGIFGEFAFIPKFLSLSARALYAQHPGTLQSSQCRNIVYNDKTLSYDSLRLFNEYTVSLDRFLFDIGLSLYPLNDIPIYIRGAANIGIGLSANTYQREQTIIEPSFVTFPNDKRTKIIDKGNVESNLMFGAYASIGYHLELTSIISLMPEIGYSHSFTSLMKNDEWKYSSIDFRIGLEYRPLEEKVKDIPSQPVEEAPIIVFDEIPPPTAQAVINPIKLTALNTPDLELQQTIITQTFPILPYIFFDSSSTIPNSIITSQNPNFKEEEVSDNTLDTYHNILGIIAKRMKSQPKATLTLTGSTDGKELPNSRERKNLALQRAQNIKDLLTKEWNINPERISIQSRELPKMMSNREYTEGDAENRRVEIESNMSEILNPVVYSTFNEYVPLQQMTIVNIQQDSGVSIQDWTLDISYHGKKLKTLEGASGLTSSINIALDSAMISSLGNQLQDQGDSVDISLIFRVAGGEQMISHTKQAIKNTKNMFEISRLSLIVFEYDESVLSDNNIIMMNNFFSKEITSESTIDITGSTDRLGEAQYNLTLSQERANAVEKAMRSMQKDLNITSVKGIGFSKLIFDNSQPEGRYYSRTVSIEVKNPIQSLPGK
jgi:outer membrane protein OmpA-like peptidoglycan-associated protein